MKTKHPVRNMVILLSAILFFIVTAVGVLFGLKGYGMYKTAIAQAPIEETAEMIRTKEGFTHYSDLPVFYVDAVISTEDHRFREHCGIDFIAICRAVWTDIKALSFEEGGSTITQQLTKNLLFTQDKTIERKIAEVFASIDVERRFSKNEIFELYVNTAYFGNGYYGIYAAATGYFGKLPSELTEYEAAMLAGVPNAPSVYAPDANTELASQRTAQVLRSMVNHKLLSKEEADRIRKSTKQPESYAGCSFPHL